MKKIKNTVGLIVLINSPKNMLKAVLQVRGNFNTETNKKETCEGASQLTAHGSVDGGESETTALLREVKEELGKDFANIIKSKLNNNELTKLNKIKNKKISIVNFGCIINRNELKKIKLNSQTGASLRFISKDEIKNIYKLKFSEKLNDIADKNDVAMFPDDIKTLKIAFKKLT